MDVYGFAPAKNEVPAFWREKYVRDASKAWNKFYRQTNGNFFKDRHWLLREFPELNVPSAPDDDPSQKENLENPNAFALRVLEIGCGAGSCVFPLLASHPLVHVHAFDFSAHAIALLKENAAFDPLRCTAEVCDWTSQDLTVEPAPDVALLVFVLSALNPVSIGPALAKLFSVLRDGGVVCCRDYGENDMAQVRFEEGWAAASGAKQANKMGDRHYVRHDGTQSFFFRQDELESLFLRTGFSTVELRTVEITQENRKEGSVRLRRFVQGRFRKPASSSLLGAQ